MSKAEAIMMVTLPSSVTSKVKFTSPPLSPAPRSPSKAHDASPILQNLQFYIIAAHNLQKDEGHTYFVRVTCNSTCCKKAFNSDASPSFTWGENTHYIGPVLGTDKVTFQVLHLSPRFGIKRFSRPIAASASYSVDSLITLQAEQKDNSISIPLSVDDKHQDAYILLHVKQPTTLFIREQTEKQLIEQAKNAEKDKESDTAPAPLYLSPTPWLNAEERRLAAKGNSNNVQEKPSRPPKAF